LVPRVPPTVGNANSPSSGMPAGSGGIPTHRLLKQQQ
jgi:hypothetical protein